MKGNVYLSEVEKVLELLLPKVKRRKDGRGRPPKDPKEVLRRLCLDFVFRRTLAPAAGWVSSLPNLSPVFPKLDKQKMLGVRNAYMAGNGADPERAFCKSQDHKYGW